MVLCVSLRNRWTSRIMAKSQLRTTKREPAMVICTKRGFDQDKNRMNEQTRDLAADAELQLI